MRPRSIDELQKQQDTHKANTRAQEIDQSISQAKDWNPSGGGGAGYGVLVGWFKLSAVASNPMTGKLQTCSAGSFSAASGAENKSIYIHPGSALANYAVNAYVFANYVGNSWVSVNIFSSDDEVEEIADAAAVNNLSVCP